MMKPDFTGEWVLNRQASSLSQAASAMDSGILRIDHRDPKCRFQMNMSAGGQSVEHAWESLSDGVEVAGGGVVSRLLWHGDTLVFEARSQSSDESWTMSWRYELLEQGRCLRAVEQLRGSGRDQDNTWIFERC
jgi:hypothetical protein